MIGRAGVGINGKSRLLFYPVLTLRNDFHTIFCFSISQYFFLYFFTEFLNESKAFLDYEPLQLPYVLPRCPDNFVNSYVVHLSYITNNLTAP